MMDCQQQLDQQETSTVKKRRKSLQQPTQQQRSSSKGSSSNWCCVLLFCLTMALITEAAPSSSAPTSPKSPTSSSSASAPTNSASFRLWSTLRSKRSVSTAEPPKDNSPSLATKEKSTTEKNDTFASLLKMTGHLLNIEDDMEATLAKSKNNTLEYFMDLPDPWTIDQIAPRIIFYHNGQVPLELNYTLSPREMATKLHSQGFLNCFRLVLITHGFHNDINIPWLAEYRKTILNVSATSKFDQTVGVIGWGGGADLLVFRYRQAAANVVPVGQWLGNITKAINELKMDLPIYGIGHSLGAHVMGVAGRHSSAFQRISGLDPAGPCFEKVNNSRTLNSKDARFVDVIHTDGYDSKLDPSEWIFPVNHYGSLVPIGTLDFYPNFGYHQPNAGTFTLAGSHLRALDLFYWSIKNPGQFLTTTILKDVPDYDIPVDSFEPSKYTVEMGYYADRYQVPPENSTGTATLFYIKTNGQVPWV